MTNSTARNLSLSILMLVFAVPSALGGEKELVQWVKKARTASDSDTKVQYFINAINAYESGVDRRLFNVALTMLAKEYVRRGENDLALQALDGVRDPEPDDVLFYYVRGVALALRHRHHSALKDMKQVDRYDKRKSSVKLCALYYYMDRAERALDSCYEAIKRKPSDAEAFLYRGYVFAKLGDYEAATADIKEFSRLTQRWGSASKAAKYGLNKGAQLQSEADLAFGYIALLKKRFKTALSFYEKALELSPNMPEAHYRKGELFLLTKKYQEAEASLNTAIEKDPEYAQAIYDRALVRNMLGWKKASLADLKAACDKENGKACRDLQSIKKASR